MNFPSIGPLLGPNNILSRLAIFAALAATPACDLNSNTAQDEMTDETDTTETEGNDASDVLPACEENLYDEPGLYLNFGEGQGVLESGDILPVVEVDGVGVSVDGVFGLTIDPCMTEDNVVQYAIPYEDNNITADDAGSVGLNLAVYGDSLAHSLDNGAVKPVAGYHSLPADEPTHWEVFVPEEPPREEE